MRQDMARDTPPFTRLALAIIDRARQDAKLGGLAALAWLASVGYDLAELVAPRQGRVVLPWSADLHASQQQAVAAGVKRRSARGYWAESLPR